MREFNITIPYQALSINHVKKICFKRKRMYKEKEARRFYYDVHRFLDEFEWYVEAFKNQREKGTPY